MRPIDDDRPAPLVLRAPMRSRLDEVDPAAAVAWALRAGLVGVGVGGTFAEEERNLARLRRFAEVPIGSFVWTRDGDGQLFVGVVVGEVVEDPAGQPHDLLNVRAVHWHEAPVDPREVPSAVLETFGRGGRNLQRVRAQGVGEETAGLWARLEDGPTQERPPVAEEAR